jgi:hypothetical protein
VRVLFVAADESGMADVGGVVVAAAERVRFVFGIVSEGGLSLGRESDTTRVRAGAVARAVAREVVAAGLDARAVDVVLVVAVRFTGRSELLPSSSVAFGRPRFLGGESALRDPDAWARGPSPVASTGRMG